MADIPHKFAYAFSIDIERSRLLDDVGGSHFLCVVIDPQGGEVFALEHDGTIYLMSGIEYTYGELIEALDAEAATLDPEQWEGGWNAHEYLIDALLVGTIERVDTSGES